MAISGEWSHTMNNRTVITRAERTQNTRFCKRCGVRLMEANRALRVGECCQVCSTVRGRREARKSQNRIRVPVAGFLPISFWK
jgi:hypothetical protein